MLYNEIFYPINQPQNDLLTIRQAGRLNEDKSYCIERNNSKTNVIAFVEKGCLHIDSGDKEFSACAGQGVFLPEGIRYTIYADENDPPIMYWMNIRGKVFRAVISAFQMDRAVFECEFYDIFWKIIKLAQDEEEHFDMISECIFSLVLRIRSGKVSGEVKKHTKREDNYEAYICNHIQGDFSVKQMARDLHMSTDAINRVFLREYGVTPYRYYQEIRIDFAKKLLTNTDLTIDDITQRLNFTDRNYFSSYFKKMTGMSPAAYRKEMKRT